MREKSDDPYARAVANILYTHSYILSRQSKLLRAYGITVGQHDVLKILNVAYPQAISVSCIQQRMINRMSNASRLVEKLNKKGLVYRELCPTDRRQVDVSITSKGRKILESLESEIFQLNLSTVHLSPDDVNLLNDLLDRLRSVGGKYAERL